MWAEVFLLNLSFKFMEKKNVVLYEDDMSVTSSGGSPNSINMRVCLARVIHSQSDEILIRWIAVLVVLTFEQLAWNPNDPNTAGEISGGIKEWWNTQTRLWSSIVHV